MFERDGKRFNCCESVIILVNQEIHLPGFDIGVMRGASNLGGGVSGWGSICGAVSGAAIVYGLLAGTDGEESPEDFTSIRDAMRGHTQEFLGLFEEKWGHVNCFDLLGVDTRTEEGKRKHEENKARGEYYCEDYVFWSAEKLVELMKRQGLVPSHTSQG
jgi:C_GCAxxG_C_C family probable redox protein